MKMTTSKNPRLLQPSPESGTIWIIEVELSGGHRATLSYTDREMANQTELQLSAQGVLAGRLIKKLSTKTIKED